jgi:hypothetical protein
MAAALAMLTTTLASPRARAFLPEGHEIIEAAAYRRLLALEEVPGAGVSGRALLEALMAARVLVAPPCFDREPRGACGAEARLETPLAFWPRLGSGAADILIDRQLGQRGQCQHFMAQTLDGFTASDARFGVPGGLVTAAYQRCVGVLGAVLDGILRDPTLAAWRMAGMYVLMHAIEDSFSAAHTRRDGQGRVVYLLSWTLIDWPRTFARGRASFPPETHHAVKDERDGDYLLADGRTEDGRACSSLHNPYAVPEACLSPEARAAVDAMTDLLVLAYVLRARSLEQGRIASLTAPADAALWEAYVRRHLPSVAAAVEPPTLGLRAPPRPDLFVGAIGSREPGGWGAGLWAGRLSFGPALPFALGLFGGAAFTRADQGDRLVGSLAVNLFLPLIRRFTIGFAPATAQVVCETDFGSCSPDAGATLGVLLVPIGPGWLGLQGPHWSWSERALTGSRFALALGWSYELAPGPVANRAPTPVIWDPPAPDEVRAFRRRRTTGLLFLAASAASTEENQTVGAGLALFLDRDRWNRRAGLAPGLELEVGYGNTEGARGAGALALAPVMRAYLVPDRLALSLTPAWVKLGTRPGEAWGVDVGGRVGMALLMGRLELAVESPPLSYLSRARWHARPFSVRLAILVP